MSPGDGDPWSHWVLHQRHGGDPAFAATLQPQIDAIRDALLDRAAIVAGETLVDLGTGDGLIAFGALARTGGDLDVVFVDHSPTLVAACEAEAVRRGAAARARFVVADARRLDALADGGADVVTVRSVIAYIDEKATVFDELFRIVRPGGRIAIAEPILADQALVLCALRRAVETAPPDADTALIALLHKWRARQLPDTLEAMRANPLTNFNERDLLRFAQRSGFTDLHLRLHVDVTPALPMPWEALLASAPLPGVPTLAEIMASSFDATERVELERRLRAVVESGALVEQNAMAYLVARKPGPVAPAA